MQLIANSYLLICIGFGLTHGIVQSVIRKKLPAYIHFILFSILCTFLSRLVYVLAFMFYDGVPDRFNVGLLGFAASFFIIFLANFGKMDGLIGDRDRADPKCRVIAMAVPILELVFSVLSLFLGQADFSVRIAFVIISVAAGFSGYLNVKHLLIPDVPGGVIRSLRGFNLTAFLIGLCTLAEIALAVYKSERFVIWVQIVLGVLYAAAVPVLMRGVKKWTR